MHAQSPEWRGATAAPSLPTMPQTALKRRLGVIGLTAHVITRTPQRVRQPLIRRATSYGYRFSGGHRRRSLAWIGSSAIHITPNLFTMNPQDRDLLTALLRHRATLVRYARVRLGSDDAAEDVVHDLWVKLQRRDVGEATEALPYLYRALANAITDHLRVRTRRSQIGDASWRPAEDVTEVAADELPNAERIVVARSRVAWVERVIGGLPPSAATALRRSRVDGLSHRQIADELGISISGVEKHLQRAYKALTAARLAEDAASSNDDASMRS